MAPQNKPAVFAAAKKTVAVIQMAKTANPRGGR